MFSLEITCGNLPSLSGEEESQEIEPDVLLGQLKADGAIYKVGG
jgi:hypothetical protein